MLFCYMLWEKKTWNVLREAGWAGVQREVWVAILIQVAKGRLLWEPEQNLKEVRELSPWILEAVSMQRKERAKRACLVRLRTSQEASESGGSVQKGVGREGGGVWSREHQLWRVRGGGHCKDFGFHYEWNRSQCLVSGRGGTRADLVLRDSFRPLCRRTDL